MPSPCEQMEYHCIYILEDGDRRIIGSSIDPAHDIDYKHRKAFPLKRRNAYIFPVVLHGAALGQLKHWLSIHGHLSGTNVVGIKTIDLARYMSTLSTELVPIIVTKGNKVRSFIGRRKRWSIL